MNRLILCAFGLLGLATNGLSAYCSTSYSTSINGVTGLYNTAGTQVATNVNINTVQYLLEYDYTHSPYGTWPMYGIYAPETSTSSFITTVRVTFSNTNWQTAPSGATVWVQVCNYNGTYDATTGIDNPGYEVDYFMTPGYSPLITKGTTGYISLKTFSDVGPKPFPLSWFSVDPADSSGKTGIYTWNATNISPGPWANMILWPNHTVVSYANGTHDYFMGVLWAFAKPDDSIPGGCSVSGRGVTWPYLVPPDPEPAPLMAKKGPLADSLARITPFDILSARRYT